MAFALRRPPNLSPKLAAFPFQMEAVKAVSDLPHAAIFHEQGLGKTKIAIDISLYWLENDIVDTVFIVTKKSLIKNWLNELNFHSYLSPRVLSGNHQANRYALNAPVLMYVMNYEVCRSNQNLMSLFQKTCRVGAILDESQKIKNPKSKLTQCFFSLANGFCRKIIMTGTPVANRPQDIWAQVNFLDGGCSLGNNFEEFKAKIDLPEIRRGSIYGIELTEINRKIRAFSVRETKTTSGIELPEKTILSHEVLLSPVQKNIYENYRDKLYHEFKTETKIVSDHVDVVLKRLLRLVQCASNPILVDDSYDEEPSKFEKLKHLLESDLLERDNKAVIWTSFIGNANWLAKKLTQLNPAVVHSGIHINGRNAEIERFKCSNECKILIATPGAAKEGLTLTVANHAIFFDRSFSLDDYLQAQDRIHRISQRKVCYIHNLIAKNSIDEWVDRLLYVKYVAAQYVQGDALPANHNEWYEIDLSEMLSTVLYP